MDFPVILLLGAIFTGLATAVGAYAARDAFTQGLDYVEHDLGDKLRRLRLYPQRLRTWLIAWLVIVLVVILTLFVIFDMPIIGLTTGLLMISLPWYMVRRLAERRRQKIEDQLADAMVSLSSAIKAGLSLAQSLEILTQQTPVPISQEFQQITGEYRLGKPLEVCLVAAKERLRSENFALFAAAMEASRESGGRLNETVDRIAHSVRELQRLERKVISETAQARASAFYMALAPLAVLLAYYFFVDPINTQRLFTTVWGQIMLSVALILNVTAYLWARVIMNPDI